MVDMVKNINEIAIFLNVRVSSNRCKNKMLRPFSGSCLIDICLEKLTELTDYKIYYGAYEKELLKKATPYRFLNVIKRSYESAHASNDGKLIFEILNHINAKWVVWINPCIPFLKMSTVKRAIDEFLEINNNSLTSAKKVFGWFFDKKGDPLTNKDNKIATQESDYLLEVAHAFHIYERKYMLDNGKIWTNQRGDPYLFEIPYDESYDIDSENDFVTVESLFNHLSHPIMEM
tara:strand:+ start:873 stop:1568 length:696 start_codon:yes stop_codon:yes gene_type:complete